mgnify:CR=1 FL=1
MAWTICDDKSVFVYGVMKFRGWVVIVRWSVGLFDGKLYGVLLRLLPVCVCFTMIVYKWFWFTVIKFARENDRVLCLVWNVFEFYFYNTDWISLCISWIMQSNLMVNLHVKHNMTHKIQEKQRKLCPTWSVLLQNLWGIKFARNSY